MTKRLIVAVLVVAFALPLHAGFGDVARALDRQKGVSRIWIPFLGIARAAVRVVEPKGVHDFQLVTFRGGSNLDGAAVQQIVRKHAGRGYLPLVQAWSRKKGEWSFVYARPSQDGKRIELMVVAHDASETVLVRVDIDAEVVARELGEPRNVTQVARR